MDKMERDIQKKLTAAKQHCEHIEKRIMEKKAHLKSLRHTLRRTYEEIEKLENMVESEYYPGNQLEVEEIERAFIK